RDRFKRAAGPAFEEDASVSFRNSEAGRTIWLMAWTSSRPTVSATTPHRLKERQQFTDYHEPYPDEGRPIPHQCKTEYHAGEGRSCSAATCQPWPYDRRGFLRRCQAGLKLRHRPASSRYSSRDSDPLHSSQLSVQANVVHKR